MLGLIAGNGRFPFLVLEEAISRGIPIFVAAIREEAEPEIEGFQARAGEGAIEVQWVGLGQLGRLIKLFRGAGVDRAMMAGQVKHVKIFARDGRSAAGRLSALPDTRTLRLLLSLRRKNTASLIGAFAEALAREGIELIESTFLLQDHLAEAGVLTRRRPDKNEERNIRCGRLVARQLTHLDIGQTVVVKDQAVVAVEAMEGTDQTIRRAARLCEGRRLTVVKAGRPEQDMRFDVPVIGSRSMDVFRECKVSALALDAGQTLLLDKKKLIREADEMGLAIVAEAVSES